MNGGYALVGSNNLIFQGQRLMNGVTQIEGRSDLAYFSFTEEIPASEQINFIPGDVVGWYYPSASGNLKPLSVLYDSIPSQEVMDVTMTLLVWNVTDALCTLCDVQESIGDAITSISPLISAAIGE